MCWNDKLVSYVDQSFLVMLFWASCKNWLATEHEYAAHGTDIKIKNHMINKDWKDAYN